MNIPNKEFIWKTVQFLLLLLILDVLVGAILSYLYFHQKSGNYALANEGIYRSKADVMIFGSSNAVHHFDPHIIKQATGLSTFNLGREGLDIIYHSTMFACVLKRYVPRVVILNLTPIELSNNDTYDRLSALLPYANQFQHVKRTVALRSRFESLKMLSRIYPFNSLLITLLKGMRHAKFGKTGVYLDSGYRPMRGRIDLDRKLLMIKNEKALDNNRVAALENFMKAAQLRGINMLVVFSPWYYSFPRNTLTKSKVVEIARKYGVKVLDYLTSERFVGRNDLFWDEGHLNHLGAEKLTWDVCSYLRNELQ